MHPLGESQFGLPEQALGTKTGITPRKFYEQMGASVHDNFIMISSEQ